MPSIRSLLLRHGYAFLFWYIFAVQAGFPIPADPILLIMGALSGEQHYSLPLSILLASVAAFTGDLIWYELGRWKGRPILRLLCRFSLEPDSCVRQTELDFQKRGPWSLLFTKFIPGMSLVATPLAGAIGMPRLRFLASDLTGCLLWSTAYLSLGVIFYRQIDILVEKLGLLGSRAGVIAALLIGIFIGFRWLQRIRFRRKLRVDRLAPDEALALLNGPDNVLVVDLRSQSEIARSGRKIEGATIVQPGELHTKSLQFPDDAQVILYCT